MKGQRIVGHGVDLVDIARFRSLIETTATDALARYFTPDELRDAGDGVVRTERLAGRFAVKEAVLKALGVGWGDGISFSDIEATTETSGMPGIRLHGKAATLATERGVSSWFVSTAHSGPCAIASVIAVAA